MKLDNVGVCSWSLQVKSIIELEGFTNKLGIKTVQLACGDPHHASWDEGDDMPIKAKSSSFKVTGAMLGFFGEDYTTPQTIEKTGGFGDPATRPGDPARPYLPWPVAWPGRARPFARVTWTQAFDPSQRIVAQGHQ